MYKAGRRVVISAQFQFTVWGFRHDTISLPGEEWHSPFRFCDTEKKPHSSGAKTQLKYLDKHNGFYIVAYHCVQRTKPCLQLLLCLNQHHHVLRIQVCMSITGLEILFLNSHPEKRSTPDFMSGINTWSLLTFYFI